MSVESGQVPERVIENLASMETVAPAAPPTVGEMLRGERERQGLAISDVANRLKYAPRQIEAIEADNFNALPGLTFVRGFARGYARLLGIDPAGLIAALARAANQDGGPTTVQLQSISASRAPLPEASTSHSSAWPWVFAIILVVAIVGGYSVYHWQAPASVARKLDTGTTTPPAGTILPVSPVAIADGAAPATSSGVATGQTPSGGPGAGGPGTRATPAGGVAGTPVAAATNQGKIKLVFKGESWTEIREAGGRVVFSRNNGANTEQTVEGEPPFELVVGNAREVRVFYRDAEVDLVPHIKVSVARFELK